jgi:hypothetical protein
VGYANYFVARAAFCSRAYSRSTATASDMMTGQHVKDLTKDSQVLHGFKW